MPRWQSCILALALLATLISVSVARTEPAYASGCHVGDILSLSITLPDGSKASDVKASLGLPSDARYQTVVVQKLHRYTAGDTFEILSCGTQPKNPKGDKPATSTTTATTATQPSVTCSTAHYDEGSSLTLGSCNTKVVELQSLLMQLKVYTGPLDGDYGTATQAAFKFALMGLILNGTDTTAESIKPNDKNWKVFVDQVSAGTTWVARENRWNWTWDDNLPVASLPKPSKNEPYIGPKEIAVQAGKIAILPVIGYGKAVSWVCDRLIYKYMPACLIVNAAGG